MVQAVDRVGHLPRASSLDVECRRRPMPVATNRLGNIYEPGLGLRALKRRSLRLNEGGWLVNGGAPLHILVRVLIISESRPLLLVFLNALI
jgi:hypothetical protein